MCTSYINDKVQIITLILGIDYLKEGYMLANLKPRCSSKSLLNWLGLVKHSWVCEIRSPVKKKKKNRKNK